VEEQLPGERRERRFARPAEEGQRPGSFQPDVTADPSNATAPSTAIESPPQTATADGAQKPTEADEAEIMTGTRKRATTAKKAAAPAASTRGRREQITDATIQTATMPFRATFGLARRAGRLIQRLR
jgi:hypothetical protein